tara:strand:- start:93 stop:224 length:132 start_codon:yes stop_codon:yes gene_type:complete
MAIGLGIGIGIPSGILNSNSLETGVWNTQATLFNEEESEWNFI